MRKSTAIGLSFAFFLLLAAGLLVLQKMEKHHISYNPESYHQPGLKAIQLLFAKHGYHLQETETVSGDQPASKLLFILSSDQTDQSHRNILMDWVKSGGILFELAEGKPLLAERTDLILPARTLKRSGTKSNDPRFRYLKYVPGAHAVMTVDTDSQHTHGIYEIKGRSFIYIRESDHGKIVFWNDPKGLANEQIVATPDNAVILLKLLQEYGAPGSVKLWDLRRNQAASNSDSFPAFFTHRAVAVILLFIAAILSLWKASARLGRTRPLTLAKGRSQNEFINSLAALFQQADSREIVIDHLYQELYQTILDLTQLPQDTPSTLAMAQLEELTGKKYPDLRRICENFENRQIYQTVNRKTFLPLVISMDNYRRELEEWNKSNNALLM